MTDTVSRPQVVWADLDADEPMSPSDYLAEPRFRARRIEVRRALRRRRRRIIGLALALVALAAVGVGALFSPLLDVDHLDIEGLRHLEPATVAEASGLATGQRLFDLDVDGAVDGVADLPWVERVTVTRRWPDTVEVRVTERDAVAVLVAGDDRQLAVTLDGTVAGDAADVDAALPRVLLDPAVDAEVGARLPRLVTLGLQMVGALPTSIAARAGGATVGADGVVTVILDDESRLVLGTGEEVEAKFLAAESLLGGAVVLDGLCSADVSVPSAPVITRSPC